MKQLFKVIALTGIISAALVSCKKDADPVVDPVTGTTLKAFSMTVTTAAGNSSTYQPTNLLKQHNSGVISINGAEGAGGIVSLNVADTLVPGTYSLNAIGPAIIGFSNDGTQTYYRSDSGTITIVTHNMTTDQISGTFSGRIVRADPADTLMVTNGQFNVAY